MTRRAPYMIQILDLWAEGWPATAIAQRVPLGEDAVIEIVSMARSIGDPRAVLHCRAGRVRGKPPVPVGNPRRWWALVKQYPQIKIVEVRAHDQRKQPTQKPSEHDAVSHGSA
jgi:hypothetical protein